MDSSEVARLNRRRAEAEFKLAKADAEDDGEDFERKRAWDWTIEESERWDKRVDKKKKHVEDVAFQGSSYASLGIYSSLTDVRIDYTQTARKIYKKQIRELKPDLETYAADKAKLVRDGTIVETEDGELIAVDRDGEFYANADSLGFIDNKPSKQAVDKLVGDLRQAEDTRMRRRKGGDEEDVTYINDKNKQFNQKLARYYNKVNSRPCNPRCLGTYINDRTVYRRNQGQFRKRDYGLKIKRGMHTGLRVMDFYAFFVISKCGVMGVGLDWMSRPAVTRFLYRQNGVHYLSYSLFFPFFFGIRCTRDRMVVTRAEVFNVYGFQYQKNTWDHSSLRYQV